MSHGVAPANGSVIYDFGMNNGDDIEYYLKKGLKVVGVEANPALVEMCRKRYADPIRQGRVVLLNCALSRDPAGGNVTFYINKKNHILSQLLAPEAHEAADFDAISVPQRMPSDIIAEYGAPHYVKVDVEHYDRHILADLFENGILPAFISSEAHSIEVFCTLVMAGYRVFNLVDGGTVHKKYGNTRIMTPAGSDTHSFRAHSAGPFGEDIAYPWLEVNSFFRRLAFVGFGWKDIHATFSNTPGIQVYKYGPVSAVPDVCRAFLAKFRQAIRGR